MSRFVRLWPTFLLCMTLSAAAITLFGRPQDAVSPEQWLLNLTMIPAWLGVRPVDGVYWSLAYELAFYAITLMAIVTGVLRLTTVALIAFVLLLAGAWAAGVGEVTYMALFAAGALFHRVHCEGWSFISAVLLAVCMVLAVDGAMARASLLPGPSPVVAGVVVAGMLGLMSLTRLIGRLPLPAMRFAGLMTYPLYLLHHKIGLAILSMFGNEVPPIVGYALVTALMLALAAGVVLWEKRTARWWRQRTVRGLDRLTGLVPSALLRRGATSPSAAIPPPAASRRPRP